MKCFIDIVAFLVLTCLILLQTSVQSIKVASFIGNKNSFSQRATNQDKSKVTKTNPLHKSNLKETLTVKDIVGRHSKYSLFRLPDGVKNGLASGLASVLVKSILQPFDTIKTVQQADKLRLSLFSALVTTIEKKGFLGLWSGIGVTVMGSAPSSAAYFGVYSSTKVYISEVLHGKFTLATVAVSAAIANSFASFIRAPFEVIKQRVQTGAHVSTWEAVTHSFQKEGVFGLFGKGKLMSQIVRDVPYAIVCLLTYEILQTAVKQLLTSYEAKKSEMIDDKSHSKAAPRNVKNVTPSSILDSFMQSLIDARQFADSSLYHLLSNRRLRDAVCGSVAGGLGSLLTTPMDVIKTRLMTDTKYGSVWIAITVIAKQEGLGTFFRGALPRLMHKVPANALFFLFYEAFRSLLGVSMTKS